MGEPWALWGGWAEPRGKETEKSGAPFLPRSEHLGKETEKSGTPRSAEHLGKETEKSGVPVEKVIYPDPLSPVARRLRRVEGFGFHDLRQQGDLHASPPGRLANQYLLRHQEGDLQTSTCFATRRATCKTVLLADAFVIYH